MLGGQPSAPKELLKTRNKNSLNSLSFEVFVIMSTQLSGYSNCRIRCLVNVVYTLYYRCTRNCTDTINYLDVRLCTRNCTDTNNHTINYLLLIFQIKLICLIRCKVVYYRIYSINPRPRLRLALE